MSNPSLGKALLGVQNIEKSFGAQSVLKDVSLTIHDGDRIGLIGVNGCGKSTLMRIMAGIETPDNGLVTRSQDLRVAMLEQQCPLDHTHTVGEALAIACDELRGLRREYESLAQRLAEEDPSTPGHRDAQARFEHLQHEMELTDAWNLDHHMKRVSVALNLPPEDRKLDSLSGGELRRVDLAVRLIQRPDILLLDEPTNQIDTKSVEWIEQFLSTYEGSCILVTHDRYFLDRVVNRIVEIEFNRLYSYPGKYGEFLDYKTRVKESEMRAETRRQAILRRELAWLKRGAKARTSKQQARIDRFYELDEQGPPLQHKDISFAIPETRRLGKIILEAHQLTFGYGDTTLVKDFSMLMQKDMRVGIVGPNGCGKTTLLRLLMNQQAPQKGELILGDNTEFLYVDQIHEEIDPEQSILKHVTNGSQFWDVGARRIFVPAYLEQFLFDIDSVRMPIKNLSGGERNRIDLAKKLLRGGNFLVLDEPTNDLDLQTLRVLEEAILDFPGCALIVSHDRYFLNRLCTHMLIFEGNGQIVQIAGNYDDYVIYKEKIAAEQKAHEATRPKKEKSKAKQGVKRRLTWHEKKELEGMEECIVVLEAEVAALEAEVNKPEFYQQDHTTIQACLGRLEAKKTEMDHLYTRWEELDAINQAS